MQYLNAENEDGHRIEIIVDGGFHIEQTQGNARFPEGEVVDWNLETQKQTIDCTSAPY